MLAPHQEEWTQNAERTIQALNRLLEPVAVDIQHIGSTAIPSIHAKPIIDLVIGVRNLDDIAPYVELLKQHDIEDLYTPHPCGQMERSRMEQLYQFSGLFEPLAERGSCVEVWDVVLQTML